MRKAILLVALAVAAGCTSDQRYEPLPVPEGADDTPPTSSTVPTALDEVVLPAVEGRSTSTTTAIGPGPVTIVGRVDGPEGPVGGARVRLERVTSGGVASMEVPTAADGSWNASNVLGGRYRIRAWLAPSYGMARAQLVFVEAPRSKPIVLRLERFEGVRVDGAIAPNPPLVGQDANVTVRLTVREVDLQGRVRHQPVVGSSVTLTAPGNWSIVSSNPQFTDGTGSVTWTAQCLEAGQQPLSVILDTGEIHPLAVPDCV